VVRNIAGLVQEISRFESARVEQCRERPHLLQVDRRGERNESAYGHIGTPGNRD
jgi:hypothetical protein